MNEAFNKSFLCHTTPNRETKHMIIILLPATVKCTRQGSPLYLEIAAFTGLHALTYSFCLVTNYKAIYIFLLSPRGFEPGAHLQAGYKHAGELCLWPNLSTLSSKPIIPGIFPFKHLHEEQILAH